MPRKQQQLKEFVVPVFLTVEAASPEEARNLVAEHLSEDEWEWPFPVVVSCVGNVDEITSEEE